MYTRTISLVIPRNEYTSDKRTWAPLAAFLLVANLYFFSKLMMALKTCDCDKTRRYTAAKLIMNFLTIMLLLLYCTGAANVSSKIGLVTVATVTSLVVTTVLFIPFLR